MLPRSATRHYRRIQRLQAVTVTAVRHAWGRMEPRGNWERQYRDDVGPKVTAVVVAAQIAAAREADAYAADVLNELDFGPPTEPGVVAPASYAGVAGDGRPVSTLLEQSVGQARARLHADTQAAAVRLTPPDLEPSPEQALARTLDWIDMAAQTLIADAAREAEIAAFAQRPWVDGWVRAINPPCCARCALLSGRFYLFNEGFLRHPRCDCFHIPAPSDRDKVRDLIAINSPERYFESLTEDEQDRIFTKSGAEAIRLGADMGQVVNARRGMRKAQVAGRNVRVTTEGATRRGRASGLRVRLMPESILEIAGNDRDEAIRLLRLHRYIT